MRRRRIRPRAWVILCLGLCTAAAVIGYQQAETDALETANYIETSTQEINRLQAELDSALAELDRARAETEALWQTIELTQDYKDLCGIVEAEARGESLEGKRAVAEVVLNRAADPRFGETISEVIHAPGQFDPADQIDTIEISAETRQAVDQALITRTSDAIYFMNPETSGETSRGWMRTKTKVATIGSHEFYK